MPRLYPQREHTHAGQALHPALEVRHSRLYSARHMTDTSSPKVDTSPRFRASLRTVHDQNPRLNHDHKSTPNERNTLPPPFSPSFVPSCFPDFTDGLRSLLPPYGNEDPNNGAVSRVYSVSSGNKKEQRYRGNGIEGRGRGARGNGILASDGSFPERGTYTSSRQITWQDSRPSLIHHAQPS